jgi:hypothetical protein
MIICEFCNGEGEDKGDGVSVCKLCWGLLQNPATALPLIRGTMTMKLRGSVSKEILDKMINDFMEMISKWERPKPPN